MIPDREQRVPDNHMLVRMFGCELRYPEYGLSVLGFWWGLWQLLFVDYGGRDSYRYMEAVGPSWMWGVVLMMLAAWLLVALNQNDKRQRRYALQALTVYWCAVLATIGIPNWWLTAMPTYSVIICFHVAAYLRLSGAITLN